MSMSFQSIFPLFLLGLVIFSTIGIGNADVNILVSKGTHINVVEVSLPQLDIQRKDNCSESPLPSPSTPGVPLPEPKPVPEPEPEPKPVPEPEPEPEPEPVPQPEAVNYFDEKLADRLRQIKAMNISNAVKRARAFVLYDTDKDGLISEEELKTAKFASDVSECVHEYDGFDADADGCFTSPEMQADTEKMEKMFGGGDTNASVFMDIMFKSQDTDQDGCLSQAERKAFCIPSLTPFNDKIFEAGAFQLIDKNEDGTLSKAEFMQLDWQKVQDTLFPVKENKKWPKSGEQKTIEYK